MLSDGSTELAYWLLPRPGDTPGLRVAQFEAGSY